MQAIVVPANSNHIGQKCVLCRHTVKARQSILVDTVNEIRFGSGRTRRYHKACMQDLVTAAPDGIDELDASRELIAATGNPWA